MKKIFIAFAVVLCAACKPAVQETRLHGSLKELGRNVVEMAYDGYSSDIYNNAAVKITPDSAGRFDVTLALDGPAYYRLGQNTIYLLPGGDLEVNIARTAGNSTFSGTVAAENEYLRGLQWSDSRSMGYGFGVMPPFTDIQHKADSLEHIRRTQLSPFADTDSKFATRESARIVADRIELHFSNIYKTEYYKWDDTPEVKQQKQLDYYRSIAPEIEPLLATIDRDEDFLQASSVREVLLECYRSGCFEMHVTPLLKELSETAEMSAELDKGITLANHDDFAGYTSKITDKGLREAYRAKLAARTRLMEGRPAPDTELRDTEGNVHRLSEHRGTPLFVDMWATWCLPCLAQSPHFKELSAEYPEITFIAISVDQNTEAWKKKVESDDEHATIINYITDVYAVGDEWDIMSIPRFLLIDADFNIVTAFAPRPADSENIIPLLDKIAGRNRE